MELSESRIQAEIVKWYNNNYCLKNHFPRGLIFSVPNGGTRNKAEAMNLLSTGLLGGVSDLVVVHNFHLVFVEVKSKFGKLSAYQIDFKNRVEMLGLKYFTVYSVDEFKELVRINFGY